MHRQEKFAMDVNNGVIDLFQQFNQQFFWGKLDGVEIKWNSKMTTCEGITRYEGNPGQCTIDLSATLLSQRPMRELLETLLHEMIHAYLFVTENDTNRDLHGPNFLEHMHRINKLSGTNITIYLHSPEPAVLHQETSILGPSLTDGSPSSSVSAITTLSSSSQQKEPACPAEARAKESSVDDPTALRTSYAGQMGGNGSSPLALDQPKSSKTVTFNTVTEKMGVGFSSGNVLGTSGCELNWLASARREWLQERKQREASEVDSQHTISRAHFLQSTERNSGGRDTEMPSADAVSSAESKSFQAAGEYRMSKDSLEKEFQFLARPVTTPQQCPVENTLPMKSGAGTSILDAEGDQSSGSTSSNRSKTPVTGVVSRSKKRIHSPKDSKQSSEIEIPAENLLPFNYDKEGNRCAPVFDIIKQLSIPDKPAAKRGKGPTSPFRVNRPSTPGGSYLTARGSSPPTVIPSNSKSANTSSKISRSGGTPTTPQNTGPPSSRPRSAGTRSTVPKPTGPPTKMVKRENSSSTTPRSEVVERPSSTPKRERPSSTIAKSPSTTCKGSCPPSMVPASEGPPSAVTKKGSSSTIARNEAPSSPISKHSGQPPTMTRSEGPATFVSVLPLKTSPATSSHPKSMRISKAGTAGNSTPPRDMSNSADAPPDESSPDSSSASTPSSSASHGKLRSRSVQFLEGSEKLYSLSKFKKGSSKNLVVCPNCKLFVIQRKLDEHYDHCLLLKHYPH